MLKELYEMAKKAKNIPAPAAPPAAAPMALNMVMLATVVAATRANSYVLGTKDEMSGFLAPNSNPPLVEFNETVSDPANPARIAFRATPAGVAAIDAAPPAAPPAGSPANGSAEGAPAETFTIDDNVPLPPIKRSPGKPGKRESKYPFATLRPPVYNADGTLASAASFFVAATEKLPNPGKTLASTVSAASKKYARKDAAGELIKDGEGNLSYERKFTIRAVDEPGRGKGARVWRVV